MGAFDNRIKKLKSYHALVLGTWAALNILSGGIGTNFSMDTLYYFFLMNFSWGIVNAFISGFIYFHHNTDLLQPQTILQQMDHQRHAEKAILFNFGLDLCFVACGAALYFYGIGAFIQYPNLWQGFGFSVMIQGTFLSILDYCFHLLHVKNRKVTHPIWQKVIEKIECE